MSLYCPECATQITKNNVDASGLRAECPICGSVHNMGDLVNTPPHQPKKKKTKQVIIPGRIKISKQANQLVIQYHWNRFMGILGLLGTIGLDIVFAMAVYNEYVTEFQPAFQDGTYTESHLMGFTATVFFLIVLITYFSMSALAHIFNTTHIKVNKKSIRIIQRPIPLRLDVNLASDTIEEIFTREKVHKGSGNDSFSYEVYVNLRGRKRKKLVDGLPEQEQASFIKQQIESFLGIEVFPAATRKHV